jgi:hypothetical protein
MCVLMSAESGENLAERFLPFEGTLAIKRFRVPKSTLEIRPHLLPLLWSKIPLYSYHKHGTRDPYYIGRVYVDSAEEMIWPKRLIDSTPMSLAMLIPHPKYVGYRPGYHAYAACASSHTPSFFGLYRPLFAPDCTTPFSDFCDLWVPVLIGDITAVEDVSEHTHDRYGDMSHHRQIAGRIMMILSLDDLYRYCNIVDRKPLTVANGEVSLEPMTT